MGRVGGGELYVIILALLLVFGPSRIGEAAPGFAALVQRIGRVFGGSAASSADRPRH